MTGIDKDVLPYGDDEFGIGLELSDLWPDRSITLLSLRVGKGMNNVEWLESDISSLAPASRDDDRVAFVEYSLVPGLSREDEEWDGPDVGVRASTTDWNELEHIDSKRTSRDRESASGASVGCYGPILIPRGTQSLHLEFDCSWITRELRRPRPSGYRDGVVRVLIDLDSSSSRVIRP